LEPKSAEVHHNLGTLFQQQGKLREAVSYYQRALERLPNSAATRLQLSETLLSLGRFNEAREHADVAVRSMPESTHPQVVLARVLLVTGQLDSSLRHFSRAAQLDADAAEAWIGMANILATHPDSAKRNPQKAIEAARRAARISENKDPLVLDTLANAYASAGQIQRAVTIEERALQLTADGAAPQFVDQLRRRLAQLKRTQKKQSSTGG